ERLVHPGDVRRVRGDAVDHAERHAFLDLAHVRGVEKDLHDLTPSFVSARSSFTRVPARTFLNIVGSPSTRPKTFTALAGRISSPVLAGVRPKKMQNALPGGQYPRSPMATVSFGDSASTATPMSK